MLIFMSGETISSDDPSGHTGNNYKIFHSQEQHIFLNASCLLRSKSCLGHKKGETAFLFEGFFPFLVGVVL